MPNPAIARRVLANAQAPSIVTRSLFGYWPLDDGAGQSARDVWGSHTLTLGATTGSETSDPAWSSKGLVFTLADGDTAWSSISVTSTEWTIFLAVQLATFGSSTRLFGVGLGSLNSNIFEFRTGSSLISGTYGVSGLLQPADSSLSTNTDYLVWARAASSGVVTYGRGTTTIASASGTVSSMSPTFVEIGNSSKIEGAAHPAGMTAYSALLYTTALTDPEISQNVTALRQRLRARGFVG